MLYRPPIAFAPFLLQSNLSVVTKGKRNFKNIIINNDDLSKFREQRNDGEEFNQNHDIKAVPIKHT